MWRKLVCGLVVVALSGLVMYAAPAASDPKADDVLTQVRAGLKQLDANGDKTTTSRIKLAKEAMSRKSWEGAKEALDSALKIDPKNVEAKALMQSVAINLPATPPPTVTKPATAPAQPATKPSGSGTAAKREVTPAELNHIRQVEWKPDETTKMLVKIDPEAKKKFVAANTDYTLASLSKLSMDEQAKAMLEKGTDDVKEGVMLMKDPASIADFKKSCQLVMKTCATAGCHQASAKGTFVLYTPPTNDAAVYTDFLILQKSTFKVKEVERLMVDRQNPESSLLLQFMLAPELADYPHPVAPTYKPPVKTKADPRYQLVLAWIQSLSPTPPSYDIDLTKDAPPPSGK